MPEFLSDEWWRDLGRQIAEACPESSERRLDLGLVVTGVPDGAGDDKGEVRYTIHLAERASAGLSIGSTDGAEVVLVGAYEDARALASGACSAAQLLEGGRLKIRLDARRLIEEADLLDVVGVAMRGTSRSEP